MNAALANIGRTLCPSSPALVRFDNDRLDDRTEIAVTDPTPWDGLTHQDLEIIAFQIAKVVRK
jgi:hypothetical protein